MKNILLFCSLATLVLSQTGCLTSKTATVSQSPTGTFTTNYVTTVNTANLALWTTGASVATTVAVNTILASTKNDPTVLADLKKAQIALDGVVSGANQATTADVINMLKANGNPVLAQEVTGLITSISALEQQALVNAGATVPGEISLSFAKAVNSGLMVGLQAASQPLPPLPPAVIPVR